MSDSLLRTSPVSTNAETSPTNSDAATSPDTKGVNLNAPLYERGTTNGWNTAVQAVAPERAMESPISALLRELVANQLDRGAGLRISPLPGQAGMGQSGLGQFPPAGLAMNPNQIAALLRTLGQDVTINSGATPGIHARMPVTSEVTGSASRSTNPELQTNAGPSTNRSAPVSQYTEGARFDQKERANMQQSKAPETKADVAHEPKRVDSRADIIAPDVSHKNIAQALESALDKMLKASTTVPEIKLTGPAPQAAAPQSETPAITPSSQATEKGAAPVLYQQSAQVSQHQGSEQTQTQTLSSQQNKPQENAAMANSSGAATSTTNPATTLHDQLLAMQVRHAIDQSLEQMHNQRAEQVRLLQQITAAQHEPVPTQKTPTIGPADAPMNTHPRHESTVLAIEKLRESVLDKFISIQTQIETAASERRRLATATQADTPPIQGRSTLRKETPIHHDAKPEQQLRHADRAGDPQKLTRPLIAGGTISLTNAAYSSVTGLAHADPTAFSLHSLGNILKTLQIFSRASTNTRLIKGMDSALERTCLTLATGAAVGMVGAEILVKTVALGIRELLRVAREGMQEERELTHEALEAELVDALDNYLADAVLEPSKRSMVADVSGLLVCSQTHQPLADVLVGSRELGSCMTDNAGRFLFTNVKIGTPYTIKFFKPFFSLSTDYVSGTCSFDSHHRVEIGLTPLEAGR